jgi:hypothetical protein
MSFWNQIAQYLYLKKKDPNEPDTSWLRKMHGINRISIFMFVLAMIIIFVKFVFIKK